MQTDLEAIPDGVAPTGAPSTAAPDPARDPEVTHGAVSQLTHADVLVPHTLIRNAHLGTLHEYIDGIERHTVIDWKAFVAFVREHFPKG